MVAGLGMGHTVWITAFIVIISARQFEPAGPQAIVQEKLS